MVFCPECGTKNDEKAEFCEECGASLKGMDKYNKKGGSNKSKIIIAIIIVVVAVVGIGGYFAYQNNRMAQTDENMLLASQLDAQALQQIKDLTTTPSTDYASQMTKCDSVFNMKKQVKVYHRQAYQTADGPYKDLIDVEIRMDDLILDLVDTYKRFLISAQSNDLGSMTTNLNKINYLKTESDKLANEYKSIRSSNPDLDEHVKNNWNESSINL